MTDLALETRSVAAFTANVAALALPDQDAVDALARFARDAKARAAWLEASRKAETSPLLAQVEAIRARFRSVEHAYKAVLDAVVARLGRHAQETRAAQEAAQAEAAKAFAAAQEAAPEARPAALALAHQTLAAAPETGRSEGVSSRAVWSFEITDPDRVPRELCAPDPARVRAAVAAGIRSIAGVRVFQEERVRVSK